MTETRLPLNDERLVPVVRTGAGRLSSLNGGSLAIAAVACVLLPLVPGLNDASNIGMLTTIALAAYLATSWNIVGGLTGQLSFGHAIFYGAGAYASGVTFARWGWHPLLGGLVGVAIAAALAVFIGYLGFRYRLEHLHFALATTAFAEIAVFVMMGWAFVGAADGFALPFQAGPRDLYFRDPRIYYWIFLAMLLIAIALTTLIRRRRLGTRFVCIRENETAASAIGIPPMRTKLAAMVISAVLTAAGGVIYAQYLRFLEPRSMFSWTASLAIVIPAMIGGTSTILGPTVGAVVYGLLLEKTKTHLDFPGGPQILVGVILGFIVIRSPKGLWPTLVDGGRTVAKRFRGPSRRSKREATPIASSDRRVVGLIERKRLRDQSSDPILRVEGLSRSFGGVRAVEDVSFTCAREERLAIIGPNGAGKTTLFALLGGFIKPNAGEVAFDGRPLTHMSPESVCMAGLTRTFQVTQPFAALTVYENVLASAYLRQPKRRAAAAKTDAVLERFGLAEMRDAIAEDLNVADRKRLELARGYATEPKLLLLDEVGAGLTPADTADLGVLVKELNVIDRITIIFVEHVMHLVADVAERVIVLDQGRVIAEGSMRSVASDPRVITAYLGQSYVA